MREGSAAIPALPGVGPSGCRWSIRARRSERSPRKDPERGRERPGLRNPPEQQRNHQPARPPDRGRRVARTSAARGCDRTPRFAERGEISTAGTRFRHPGGARYLRRSQSKSQRVARHPEEECGGSDQRQKPDHAAESTLKQRPGSIDGRCDACGEHTGPRMSMLRALPGSSTPPVN